MSFQYEEIRCPECNGEMISRTGKFGVFWGCKKFPECKGTRDNLGRSKKDKEKENVNLYKSKDRIREERKEEFTHREKFSFNKK